MSIVEAMSVLSSASDVHKTDSDSAEANRAADLLVQSQGISESADQSESVSQDTDNQSESSTSISLSGQSVSAYEQSECIKEQHFDDNFQNSVISDASGFPASCASAIMTSAQDAITSAQIVIATAQALRHKFEKIEAVNTDCVEDGNQFDSESRNNEKPAEQTSRSNENADLQEQERSQMHGSILNFKTLNASVGEEFDNEDDSDLNSGSESGEEELLSKELLLPSSVGSLPLDEEGRGMSPELSFMNNLSPNTLYGKENLNFLNPPQMISAIGKDPGKRSTLNTPIPFLTSDEDSRSSNLSIVIQNLNEGNQDTVMKQTSDQVNSHLEERKGQKRKLSGFSVESLGFSSLTNKHAHTGASQNPEYDFINQYCQNSGRPPDVSTWTAVNSQNSLSGRRTPYGQNTIGTDWNVDPVGFGMSTGYSNGTNCFLGSDRSHDSGRGIYDTHPYPSYPAVSPWDGCNVRPPFPVPPHRQTMPHTSTCSSYMYPSGLNGQIDSSGYSSGMNVQDRINGSCFYDRTSSSDIYPYSDVNNSCNKQPSQPCPSYSSMYMPTSTYSTHDQPHSIPSLTFPSSHVPSHTFSHIDLDPFPTSDSGAFPYHVPGGLASGLASSENQSDTQSAYSTPCQSQKGTPTSISSAELSRNNIDTGYESLSRIEENGTPRNIDASNNSDHVYQSTPVPGESSTKTGTEAICQSKPPTNHIFIDVHVDPSCEGTVHEEQEENIVEEEDAKAHANKVLPVKARNTQMMCSVGELCTKTVKQLLAKAEDKHEKEKSEKDKSDESEDVPVVCPTLRKRFADERKTKSPISALCAVLDLSQKTKKEPETCVQSTGGIIAQPLVAWPGMVPSLPFVWNPPVPASNMSTRAFPLLNGPILPSQPAPMSQFPNRPPFVPVLPAYSYPAGTLLQTMPGYDHSKIRPANPFGFSFHGSQFPRSQTNTLPQVQRDLMASERCGNVDVPTYMYKLKEQESEKTPSCTEEYNEETSGSKESASLSTSTYFPPQVRPFSIMPTYDSTLSQKKVFRARHFYFTDLKIGSFQYTCSILNYERIARVKLLFSKKKMVYEFQLNDVTDISIGECKQLTEVDIPFKTIVGLWANGKEVRVEVNVAPKMFLGTRGYEKQKKFGVQGTAVYDRKNAVDLTEGQLNISPYHYIHLKSSCADKFKSELRQYDPYFEQLLKQGFEEDPTKSLLSSLPVDSDLQVDEHLSSSHGGCRCIRGCHSIRCSCCVHHEACSPGCICKNCRNPLNILVALGLPGKLASTDPCLMENIYKIDNLESYVKINLRLDCCQVDVMLLRCIPGVFTCPTARCGAKYKYSWCLSSLCREGVNPRNHCVKCASCTDFRNVHCEICNKCYFAGISGFKCPTCKARELDSSGPAAFRHLYSRTEDASSGSDA